MKKFRHKCKSFEEIVYVIIFCMISSEIFAVNENILKCIEEILPKKELSEFLRNGSKRIRSKIAILFLRAFDKALTEDICNIITACELIHNASLLHDDVIDNSELRRGVTTIGQKFSSNVSILSGDYLVSKSIELLLKVNNMKIFNIFNKCVQNMSVAEIKQYFLRDKNLSKEDYIEICKGKTAGLFSAVLESCFIISGLDTEVALKFGTLFGIYYQLKNDMESYSLSIDQKNGIYTLVDIEGIENTQILLDNYKRELKGLLAKIPQNQYSLELEGIIYNL